MERSLHSSVEGVTCKASKTSGEETGPIFKVLGHKGLSFCFVLLLFFPLKIPFLSVLCSLVLAMKEVTFPLIVLTVIKVVKV